VSWPEFAAESVAWEPDASFPVSRRQRLRNRGSYQGAVAPLIAKQQLAVSSRVLALADEAVTEIARFDVELGQMIAPFASILLRSEAASSSQIENLTASPAAIIRAEIGLRESVNSSLIVSNQRAMSAAVAASSSLSVETLLLMHRVLMEKFDPQHAGQLREVPVWIGGDSFGPHLAHYVAPKADAVPELMADLLAFCERDDLPALVLVAIAHAQFESIHPFTDGNGRTGRALVQVLLNRLGISQSVMVPVSAGLLHDTANYFAALDRYRAGDPEPIIEVFAKAALLAVTRGRVLALELQRVRADWDQLLNLRSDAGAMRLLDELLGTPVINRSRATALLGISPANAQLAIDKLVTVGILTQQGTGQRNRIWQALDVLGALDDFASSLRR
jgi:Fic family protein